MYHTPEYQQQIRNGVIKLIADSNRSEREISLAMGCDPSYLNKIVNGKGFFSLPKLLVFLDVMKITPEEFFPPMPLEEASHLNKSEAEKVSYMFSFYKKMTPEAQEVLCDILHSYNKINR